MNDSRAGDRPLEGREAPNRGVDEAEAGDRPAVEDARRPNAVSRALGDRRVVRGAAVTAVLVIVGALLWIAGELHYQSCLQKADIKSPGTDSLSRLVRQSDVEGCSRLPF